MKKVLGLDLGTNSIGWAVIQKEDNQLKGIECSGSRIIPMDAATLGEFNLGNTKSQTAERTRLRGARRLRQRYLLRRERIHRVLNKLQILPKHYAKAIDFEQRLGQFKSAEIEVKLPWSYDEAGNAQFLFQNSFNEMLTEFQRENKTFLSDHQKVPYDWTLYYLRHKALQHPISLQELTWIILNFNVKRGYNELRGEEKIDETKLKTDKEGNVKRSFRMPKEGDWILLKKKTECDIDKSEKTLGSYIYEQFLAHPKQKIKGALVSTIDRRFYKEELKQILTKQAEFHTIFSDKELLKECLFELYPKNEAHRNMRLKSDLIPFLLNDVIFYQRPLKSKKSLIADCAYEIRCFVDNETGEKKKVPIKCTPKSNPYFQEFRLLQFIDNIRIYQREKEVDGRWRTDVDVTNQLIPSIEKRQEIYEKLTVRKYIEQKTFLRQVLKMSTKEAKLYRWNYVEDKKYPCNETKSVFLTAFKKAGIDETFLTPAVEMQLWHLFYSINDKKEWEQALGKFQKRYQLPEIFKDVFIHLAPFSKDYGAYSEKAIKKLLMLMRYTPEERPVWLKERITEVLKYPEHNYIQKAKKQGITLKTVDDFKALPVWLACYVVYGRHSEAKTTDYWKTPEHIDSYLKGFKQHSLRNPIVEQVVTETLRTVRDIWKATGQIDEIHLELGREMKNPADKRKRLTKRTQENERTNYRIKQFLMELSQPEYKVENVRPYSPNQQQLLRLYEGTVLAQEEIPDDISKIVKKFSETTVQKQPTKSEIMRYKLWLEQKYRSPYTGEIIPLSHLFTDEYEIEHVIPQSLFFDDAMSNKVICEAAVNKKKSNELGYAFIQKHAGEKISCGFNRTVEIYSLEAYEKFVMQTYANDKAKKKKLLMDEIPASFTERQMNDSRYISKFIQHLLSNIVREEDEKEVTAKRLIVCTGGVTDRLKKDWGVNDVWNELITPRFERLNERSRTEDYGYWTQQKGHRFFRTQVPLELQKNFNKKRIDHRHHAMDAIVIACATRNHINYLNNLSAKKGAEISRKDLQHLLCQKQHTDNNGNYRWVLKKPWESFTLDTKRSLSAIVVSFKQNLRVLTRATNKTLGYDSTGKKVYRKQTKGDRWAIRKPLHEQTFLGRVNLRFTKNMTLKQAIAEVENIVDKALKHKMKKMLAEGKKEKVIKQYFEEHNSDYNNLNLKKIPVYCFSNDFVATRKTVDESFTKKKIEKITDTGIQKILLAHLAQEGGDPKVAFNADGIEEMNRNIISLNEGKYHQPIRKVRIYETLGSKFVVGETGNKSKKYVVTAQNTNLYFAVYVDGEGKRNYISAPLNEVIERKKKGDMPVANRDQQGNELLFYLSPGDLVYVPTSEEQESGVLDTPLNVSRVYKLVNCSSNRSFFIPHNIANVISSPLEFTSRDKLENLPTGESIKKICIPLSVDRLGNIKVKYNK